MVAVNNTVRDRKLYSKLLFRMSKRGEITFRLGLYDSMVLYKT